MDNVDSREFKSNTKPAPMALPHVPVSSQGSLTRLRRIRDKAGASPRMCAFEVNLLTISSQGSLTGVAGSGQGGPG